MTRARLYILAGAIVFLSSRVFAAELASIEAAARTVLAEHCVSCHGPEKQKSGLRLDSLAAIAKGASGGGVLVAGDADASRLIQAVRYDDPALQMPPAGKLADDAIAALTAWVRAGATWDGVTPAQALEQAAAEERERLIADEKFWAFRPVSRPTVPGVANSSWTRNPIDSFVLVAMLEKNLTPSPEADRRALIRRVYLDVLGLPPTPDEIDSFIDDPDPGAYEKLIDRVLASPHYGERWARHWLDVVRFAETNGYETNTPRKNAWPYRDYVINALNDDIPYTQFIKEQLAGDVLGADIATGFLVGGASDEVKSPDIVLTKNQRDAELNDMVSTTGVAFLGLTVGCAKCHDHKFDPISRRDYYAMRACFEGVRHGERELILREDDPRQQQMQPLRKALGMVEAKLLQFTTPSSPDTVFVDNRGPLDPRSMLARAEILQKPKKRDVLPVNPKLEDLAGNGLRIESDRDEDVFAWQAGAAGTFEIWLSWQTGDDTLSHDARYWLDMDGDTATRDDQVFLVSVDQQRMANGVPAELGRIRSSGFQFAGTHRMRDTSKVILRSSALGPNVVNADLVAFRPVQQRSDAAVSPSGRAIPALRVPVNVKLNLERFEPIDAKFVRMTIFESGGMEPCIDEFEVFTADAEPRNVAAASAGAIATASTEYAGSEKHKIAHLNDGLYGNSQSWIPAEKSGSWAQIELAAVTRIDRVMWARDRDGQFNDRLATRYVIEVAIEPGSWRIVATSGDRLPKGETDPAIALYGDSTRSDPRIAALFQERDRIQSELDRIWPYPQRIYAGSFEKPGETRILRRGDPMQEEDTVTPASLSNVRPALTMPADEPEPQRRLRLAEWIASRDNPLTARVMVNRIWKHHFGRGIVDTPGDFGAMGAPPTHRELLDWLASEFMDEGWRMKHIHRLILLSSTYRQSSTPRPEAAAIDADTRYLWRFPARRLEAEPIRDSILFVSGKLNTRMGGPGYDPFEPDNTYVHIYIPKTRFGEDEFRRMIYQWKPRKEQDYTFGVFDCPDASQTTPKRVSSTSPLQALSLLNSPFCTQQAEFFAERVAKESSEDVTVQTIHAFRLALGRDPDPEELDAARALVTAQGLMHLCRALYNSNEFVYLP